MMEMLAISIFAFCMVAGVRSINYFISATDDPKRWYVIAKGAVILYLGVLYGIIAIDFYFDIVKYPTQISTATGQLLRVAAVVTSFIFLMDSWMRTK